MTNRLMISVAAVALIAGTSFANAQGTGMSREAPSAAPAQSSPSSDRGNSAGQMSHDATQPEMKSTPSEEKSPAAGKRADDNMKGNMQGPKNKTLSSENADKTNGGKDMKSEGRDQARDDHNDIKNAQDTDRKMSNETTGNKTGRSSETVGQAGAGAKMSSEQRTKITTVIKEQHVAPVTNVNFTISVGTRVPRDVTFHPLPTEIVTVYPDWRGYEFILVSDQIVVINPSTLEIVAVIDA